jgi:hypothetical protein
MRWILLSTMLAAPCLGGEPPFSHIRRRPSISPYIRMDEEFFMPYQMEVRPTGHPTYFMIFDFRPS